MSRLFSPSSANSSTTQAINHDKEEEQSGAVVASINHLISKASPMKKTVSLVDLSSVSKQDTDRPFSLQLKQNFYVDYVRNRKLNVPNVTTTPVLYAFSSESDYSDSESEEETMEVSVFEKKQVQCLKRNVSALSLRLLELQLAV